MAKAKTSGGVMQIEIPAPLEGVNLTSSVDKLKGTEAAQLRGFEFDEYGVIGVPRAPRDLGVIAAGTKVLSAGVFDRGTLDPILYVHLSDGSIRYSQDWINTTGTATWATLVTGQGTAPAAFVQFLSAMWISVYNVNLHKVTSSLVLTSYPGSPKGYSMAVWKDTMWQANIPGAPDKVMSCAPGDPTNWPALNYTEIGKGEEGTGIIGIWPTETALAVFKRNRTHILHDPVEFTNRLLDPDKGLLKRDSMVVHNGRMYFTSEQGVCRYLGDGPSAIISQKLGPLFNDAAGTKYGTSLATRVYSAHAGGGSAYSFNDHIGFHIPTTISSPYTKYWPDLPETPWMFGVPASEPTGGPNQRFVRFVVFRHLRDAGDGSLTYDPEELYEISGDPAKLYRHYDAPASTAAVTSEWDTSWQDFDDPLSEKWLSMLQVLHRGPIDVFVRSDYDRDLSIPVATALNHGEPELQESTIYCDVYGRSFQISIRGATAGELKQQLPSGSSAIGEISRFQAGVASIACTAQKLSAYRR